MDSISIEQRSYAMSRVRSCDTKPEMLIRRSLFRLGFRFRLHVKTLPGTPDIVLARFRTVIFVNGCFWHGHSCRRGKLPSTNVSFWATKIAANKRRDRRVIRKLRELGWNVVVIWACKIPLSQPGTFLPKALKSALAA